jgi:MFS transporter, DHA3 family, macrolide efflux protein
LEIGHHRGVDWKALFAQRGFRYFFAGTFVSLFGTGMNFSGVTWYILGKTHSTLQVALMVVLVTLPGLFVPPFGGVLIDRLDRRYLGIGLDLARGFIVGGTAALLYFHHGGLRLVDFMVLLLGMGFSIYWSTTNALVQEVIPPGQFVGANAAVLIAVQGGMAIAGGFVGYVFDRAGISAVLAIDAATYFISAFCLLRLRRGHFPPSRGFNGEPSPTIEAPPPLAAAEQPVLPPIVEPGLTYSFLADIKEGLVFLRQHPGVLALGVTYACMMAGVISANVLIVALTKDVLHTGARGYGAMESGWAIGAIAGGFAAGALVRRFRPATILLVALSILAVGHVLFPYAGFLAVAVAMFALFGGCRALGGVLTQSTIMYTVPRRLMGRTQSAFSVLSTILQAAMSLTLGLIAQWVNVPVAFFVLGLLYGVAVVAAWQARRLEAFATSAAQLG